MLCRVKYLVIFLCRPVFSKNFEKLVYEASKIDLWAFRDNPIEIFSLRFKVMK